ncbi:4-coumarate--CoA ligase 3 [Tolypocladium ophioglossoides CBS 100239]|uniref:4-coumarate--CoA ligase 3 n=1 Tax=Tolypocladium ophioglossoides (strain CBS 100239) TaxID=1163406 RepID=A0A0L0MYL1_TOLOC|nr:4-coumarate--CoA ligase 3 [Tolypocladium ophioglossoides CBS 100239]
MPFTSPSYIPKLPFSPPDSVPVHEFLFGRESSAKYGRRHSLSASKPPFVCGVTGQSYSAVEVSERIELLARGLASELEWQVNEADAFDKTLAVFSLNTIDTLTVSWATHRLNGISVPISSLYSVDELAGQLKKTKCKGLVTCAPLLDAALSAAELAGLPRTRIFLLQVPEASRRGVSAPEDMKSIDQLIDQGRGTPPLSDLAWEAGRGAKQTAFLCSSSGTSGLPKNVMISHRNAIANIMQIVTYESTYQPLEPELCLGVLPQSHIYSLVVVSQASIWRGDGVVVRQGFELGQTLKAIQYHKIKRLWLVPPMIVAMTKAPRIVESYDLRSVRIAAVGASGISKEIILAFGDLLPECKVVQGYGMTESTGVVCFGNVEDAMTGSCGHLYPGYEARLIGEGGKDVEAYNTPGELVLRSPSVVVGYFQNEEATAEAMLEGKWLRTGDLMEVRKSDAGHEHLFIVDRVKELIKVRGLQVAPAELESHLLLHWAVAEVSVIPLPDERAGELPRAYIVRATGAEKGDEDALRKQLRKHVMDVFARHKHLDGGIEFLDQLPKTASGKIQRRVLKEKARVDLEARKAAQAKRLNAINGSKTDGVKRPETMEVFDLSSDEDEE